MSIDAASTPAQRSGPKFRTIGSVNISAQAPMIEILILIAAVVISFLVFSWLINVVKTTISTALTIAILLLILQLVFGIGADDIWQGVQDFFQGTQSSP